MEIVSLDELHAQCNIDIDDNEQDELLLSYAKAAAETVFAFIGRRPVDVIEYYGEFPESIKQAVRLLVGDMYANREAGRPSSVGDPIDGVKYLLYPWKLLR